MCTCIGPQFLPQPMLVNVEHEYMCSCNDVMTDQICAIAHLFICLDGFAGSDPEAFTDEDISCCDDIQSATDGCAGRFIEIQN